LAYVGVYDNENNKLTEKDLRSNAFGWMPKFTSAVTSGDLSELIGGTVGGARRPSSS